MLEHKLSEQKDWSSALFRLVVLNDLYNLNYDIYFTHRWNFLVFDFYYVLQFIVDIKKKPENFSKPS